VVGKEQLAWNQRQCLDAWDSIELVVTSVETTGNRVVVVGGREKRRRSSGAGGEMSVVIVFTFENGLVKRFDWYSDADDARRAAGLA
jgi:ketosteroid isomerase-like protein